MVNLVGGGVLGLREVVVNVLSKNFPERIVDRGGEGGKHDGHSLVWAGNSPPPHFVSLS